MPIGAILGGIGKFLLGSAIGGAAKGLSNRLEAQIGGRKTAQFATSGAPPSSVTINPQTGSTQFASQGQQQTFSSEVMHQQFLAQDMQQQRQHEHERSQLQMQLSAQGQSDAGQTPWWGRSREDEQKHKMLPSHSEFRHIYDWIPGVPPPRTN